MPMLIVQFLHLAISLSPNPSPARGRGECLSRNRDQPLSPPFFAIPSR